VDPAAVAAQGLPRIESWVPQIGDVDQWLRTHFHAASRQGDESGIVTLKPGSYSYRYVAGDAVRGLSIEGEKLTDNPSHQMRVTRLR